MLLGHPASNDTATHPPTIAIAFTSNLRTPFDVTIAAFGYISVLCFFDDGCARARPRRRGHRLRALPLLEAAPRERGARAARSAHPGGSRARGGDDRRRACEGVVRSGRDRGRGTPTDRSVRILFARRACRPGGGGADPRAVARARAQTSVA